MTAMSIPLIFDYRGVRLNGEKADGKRTIINWDFTDTGETYALNLSNSALTYPTDWQAPDADLTVTLARAALDTIMFGNGDV